MNLFTQLWTAFVARNDARREVDLKEQRLLASVGLSPAEVEKGSYVYRTAAQQVADTGRLEELREDLRRGEDLEAVVGSPLPFTLALAFAWLVEFAGAILLLKSLGIPAGHRVLPGVSITLALIGLTWVTVKVVGKPRLPVAPARTEASEDTQDDPDGEASAASPRPPIEWGRYLLPLVYGVLVVAIALLRVVGSNAEDLSPLAAWSEAVLMVAVTVGPAFAAAWIEKRRAPAVELARRLRVLRGRVGVEEKRLRRAERHLVRVDRATVAWTQDLARRRATYSAAHQFARAEQQPSVEVLTPAPLDRNEPS